MKTFILLGEKAITNFQEENWNDFIELSEQDLKDIEANTKIEIEW